MKKIIYSAAGAILLGTIGFMIGAAISQFQVRVLLYSPDKAAPFIDAFLLSWPLFFILGGWLGYRICKKKTIDHRGYDDGNTKTGF